MGEFDWDEYRWEELVLSEPSPFHWMDVYRGSILVEILDEQ